MTVPQATTPPRELAPMPWVLWAVVAAVLAVALVAMTGNQSAMRFGVRVLVQAVDPLQAILVLMLGVLVQRPSHLAIAALIGGAFLHIGLILLNPRVPAVDLAAGMLSAVWSAFAVAAIVATVRWIKARAPAG